MQNIYRITVPEQTATFTFPPSAWELSRHTLEELLAPHLPENREVEWYHPSGWWNLVTPHSPENRKVEWYESFRSYSGPQRIISSHGYFQNAAPYQLWPDLVVCDTLARARGIRAVLGEHSAFPFQASDILTGFRERFMQRVQAEGRHVNQVPGAESFGHVVLAIEPDPTLDDVVFEGQVGEKTIPEYFLPTIASALREGVFRGGLRGYPLSGFRATLVGGRHHDIDSNGRGYRSATLLALQNALRLSGMQIVQMGT